jgi:NADPH:quinone reductase-like Zn-dependent oxidoreductase
LRVVEDDDPRPGPGEVCVKLLREHRIHPVVAERLPLSEARRAHEMLERSAAKGKLVLVP